MITLFIFLAVLAVLVLSHEFGHFIVARRSGIKVEEFGFGFPPRIVGIRRLKFADGRAKWHIVWGNRQIAREVETAEHEPGTVYSLNLLPLGGFVKIKGEEGDHPNDPDSFLNKPIWQRALVVVAGVVMNVALAWVLLSIGFMVGVPSVAEGNDARQITERAVHIMQVLPGKPAEAAGFRPGDIIEQVGDLKNPTLKTVQEYIHERRAEVIAITVRRGSERISQLLQPITYPDTGRGGIGIAIAEVGLVRYPWYQAIYQGALATGAYLKEIGRGLFFLFKGLVSNGEVAAGVSGPVGIAVITGQVAKLGFAYLIQFTALLSLNLAVLNILPIPALDGGRLLFLVLGKLLGRPVSLRLEHIIHSVGFVLLLLLVLLITFKDLRGLLGW